MNIGQCEMPEYNPPSEEILEILRKVKKIAIVGLSPKENRDSNKVARYLMKQGYEIIPVNPGQRQILGQTCYKSLSDIPFDVDMADLFLNPKRVPPVVGQAIDKGIPIIWMQLGVVHNEAARKAMEAGIQVIMNKCVKMEHQAMVCSSSR
ncbi:MAG TPA: CoA-binding protein [Desulfobacteraceae bacterium]|nr:CoA-binding protein [Desulfobacteraceae bacterium]